MRLAGVVALAEGPAQPFASSTRRGGQDWRAAGPGSLGTRADADAIASDPIANAGAAAMFQFVAWAGFGVRAACD